ncbi:MAG TPA: hypothetical protein VJ843_03520 [Candidatus Saccharimonadales bacterium]|nr:hypothetical protein [Candidatus Saccharimonadales bacterium]
MDKTTLIVGLMAAIIGGGIVAKLASRGYRAAAITIIVVSVLAAIAADLVK